MKNVISGICIFVSVVILVLTVAMVIDNFRIEAKLARQEANAEAYAKSWERYYEAAYREACKKAIEESEPKLVEHHVTYYEYRDGEVISVGKVIYEEMS